VKFLEPRHNSSERLGVVGVKFYGFERKAAFTRSSLCSVIVWPVDLLKVSLTLYCLQCFDAVGWAAGRASGL